MTPMTFNLPVPLAQAVREEAVERGLDLSDVGRAALRKHLRKRLDAKAEPALAVG